ncbi:MAG: Em GEA1 (EM1) [bacterium]|nr:Em GEA1 (EM1) [bacterium]
MQMGQRGKMTVEEAGRKGGSKGGRTTSQRYGRGFYHDIGTKGGHRVRELIEEGKEAEER